MFPESGTIVLVDEASADDMRWLRVAESLSCGYFSQTAAAASSGAHALRCEGRILSDLGESGAGLGLTRDHQIGEQKASSSRPIVSLCSLTLEGTFPSLFNPPVGPSGAPQ